MSAQRINKFTLADYQEQAAEFARYPEASWGTPAAIAYASLGLAGEAGEVANKVKKILRDKGGVWTTEDRDKIGKELGDVLWYLAALADEFALHLDDVAAGNLKKLSGRQDRGTIQGSGDDR